jgi:hypothetical protein
MRLNQASQPPWEHLLIDYGELLLMVREPLQGSHLFRVPGKTNETYKKRYELLKAAFWIYGNKDGMNRHPGRIFS